jgi:hypothetical protein
MFHLGSVLELVVLELVALELVEVLGPVEVLELEHHPDTTSHYFHRCNFPYMYPLTSIQA